MTASHEGKSHLLLPKLGSGRMGIALIAATALLTGGLLVSFLFGFWTNRLIGQPVWNPEGVVRLAWFVAGYSAVASPILLWRPRWFPPVWIAWALLWAIWMAGPGPVASVVLFLAAAYAVGSLATRRTDSLALAAGVGLYSLVSGSLMFFPVNTRLVHSALQLAPLIVAWRSFRHLPRAMAAIDGPRWLRFALGLAALIHLAAVLKPEAGADALAMHLALPATVARQGFWHFDVTRTAWAVMPMGANWTFVSVYLTGGEWACRLLNFSYFLLVLALLWQIARAVEGEAGLAVLLFATTPVTQLVTGSLFVENYWAVMILATFSAVWRYRGSLVPRDLWLAAWFAGCALAAKTGSLPILLAIGLGLPGPGLLARLPAALAILAVSGLGPYLNAWWRTANPVFPFANAFFRSPFFETRNLVDARFPSGLHWTTPYELTFHSHRFIEAQDGALGFHWWFFLPLAMLVRWSEGRWTLLLATAGGIAAFAWQSNLRYFYPVLPLASVLAAIVLADFRRRGIPWRALVAASLALALLNMAFLPSSGWLHKDFCLSLLDPTAARQYLDWAAPQRRVIEWLNQNAGGRNVIFLAGNAVAGLDARAYTNSWHHPKVRDGRLAAESPAQVARLAASIEAANAIAPASVLPSPALREFVERYTRQEFAFGSWRALRILPGPSPPATTILGPGAYDDADPGFRYAGPWFTDTQFSEAARGTITYTRQPNASVEFRFRGSRLTYVFTRAPNRGRVTLDLDGEISREIDLRGAVVQWQAKDKIDAGPGEHRATLRLIGDGYADIDGWEVEQ